MQRKMLDQVIFVHVRGKETQTLREMRAIYRYKNTAL
jgi:hypothetical protein